MKDFRLFDIYDFLMDEDFIRWVRLCRKEDNDFWNNWLAQHPDKHIVIAEAKSILESLGKPGDTVTEAEKEAEIENLLVTIKDQPAPQLEIPVRKLQASGKWWYVAATLLIAIAGSTGYFLLKNKPGHKRYDYASVTPSKRLIENVNTSDKPVIIHLPDESTVKLLPNSRIAYANDFDSMGTRDVYLLGEAFFTVTKKPSRPFRVFANEIVTKVLGTSFTVRSFEKDSMVRIVVKTGKVSVYSQESVKETEIPGHLGGIIVSPNQELVYQKEKQQFKKVLLDNPTMIVPDIAEKSLVYDDYPLEKVLDQLGKNYGINIFFDNEILKPCTITADLRNLSFYERLDLICKAIGARYELIDGQVVIQTNGCSSR